MFTYRVDRVAKEDRGADGYVQQRMKSCQNVSFGNGENRHAQRGLYN